MGPNLYPDQSFAGQSGMQVPSTQGAGVFPGGPAAPSAGVQQPKWSPGHEQWKERTIQNPTSQFSPPAGGQAVNTGDPSANVTRYGGGSQNVDLSRDNSWMAFTGQPEVNNSPGAVNQPIGPVGRNPMEPADIVPRNYGGASGPRTTGYRPGGGGGGGGQPGSGQPMEALKAPELPDWNSPGYNPPEEDPNAYKNARREEMGPGMRELREGTREAISSAQSLDNPNARSKFIQQSLKGYGQGLEKVASGASRSARGIAKDKRKEQLHVYDTKHQIKSNNYLVNYQNEINTIAADFASQQAAQVANFNSGYSEAGGGGQTSYAPNKTGPSKSMQKYGMEVIYG
jgi:hypothetical protein